MQSVRLADRLGWLVLPEMMAGLLDELEAFAGETGDAGIRHAVLLGMGGSKLAPEVSQRTFGSAPGHPGLIVLDSTHPVAVRAASSRNDLRHSIFLVSSKSGATIETLSLFEHFWETVGRAVPTPRAHFTAITDPGTPLARARDGQEAAQIPEPGEAAEVSAAAQDALDEALRAWQAQVRDGDYIGLQPTWRLRIGLTRRLRRSAGYWAGAACCGWTSAPTL